MVRFTREIVDGAEVVGLVYETIDEIWADYYGALPPLPFESPAQTEERIKRLRIWRDEEFRKLRKGSQ